MLYFWDYEMTGELKGLGYECLHKILQEQYDTGFISPVHAWAWLGSILMRKASQLCAEAQFIHDVILMDCHDMNIRCTLKMRG